MTLVFGQSQPVNQPQTHLLVVGVGRYLHLGGAKPTPNLPPLGQLASPPVSARAFADWFTGGATAAAAKHHNPDAPLGSVELLLSDATSQQYATPTGAVMVEDCTMLNIERAFNEWFARCDAHQDNVAIFYFCGHGLQKDTPVLLAEDFGRNPNNPWLTAIDFERTYRGMAQCRARTQYYIVDSCRQWTRSLLEDLDVQGQTLKRAKVGEQRPRTAPRLFATANGLPAFGDTGGVSRLTSALISCLNGAGADRRNGRWVVDTTHLGVAVYTLIEWQNADRPADSHQIADASGGELSAGLRVLHVLRGEEVPVVWVTCCCEPDAATTAATFYARRGDRMERAPQRGRWTLELEGGTYEIGADFTDGEYVGDAMEEYLRPPVRLIELEVTQNAQRPT
jgi:hypothetical protein